MSDGKTEPLRAGDPRRVGTYRLVARLGAGGMGRVYLGRSPGGRPVAVKVIHPHLAGDPEFRRRFGQEIAAARRVGGVHTAQVVDAGTDADPPWLVTEYIAGPSLQEAVGEHGPLSAESVAGLGAGLAEGLMAVHDRNVIHRDLKPGNVLLARDGLPRIIDFGIARALDATSQTTRTSVVGTPGFMSPEQFRGREVGRASDVFCLAAVLAFAATGRRPFGDGPIEALGYRVVNEEPDLTGVPESLLPLIAAGLAKDPDDRPGLDTFLERCSALADGGEPPLPDSVTTMIATRVAETEALVPPPGDAPRGTLRLPRPGAPRSATAAGAAAVAGVLVVAFAIWAIAGGGDEPGGSGTAVAQTSPTRTPAATRTPTPGASASDSPTPTPTPTRDPVREAFGKISEGDCLDAYRSPHDGDWTSEKPRAVDCSRADARLKVLEIEEGGDYANCGGDSGDIDGALWWSHGEDEQEIALCVERRLDVGDCFLGTDGPEENTVSISNGDLMTSVPCGANSIPGTYDHILKVTAITRGECPPAHRDVDWEFRGGKLCTRIV